MSEQKIKGNGYMAELDQWVEQEIITPLVGVCEEHGPEVFERVKKVVREKVLESYRNGQKAPSKADMAKRGERKWK